MRFTDFNESRLLLEAAQTGIQNDLDIINKTLDKAEKTDAALVVKAKSVLQYFINQADKLLNKVHHDNHENNTEVGPAPINENVAVNILTHELQDKIAEICRVMPDCDAYINNFYTAIDNFKDKVVEGFAQERAQGRAEAEKAAVDFMNQIDVQLGRLAVKVDGFTVPNYRNAGFTKKQIKAFQTREKVQTGLMGLFDNLFRKKIKTGELSQEEALAFAKAAADGDVIDMRQLVQNKERHGSVDDYVNPSYKNVYNIVIDDLMNAMPGSTGGATGPGEVALAALGNPSQKAENKGDLVIDGVLYELKGGGFIKGEAATGGRLNGDRILASDAAHAMVVQLLKKEHNNLYKAMQTLFNKGEWKGRLLISGITASGVVNYEKALNLAGYNKQQTIDFLHDLGAIFTVNYHDIVNSRLDQYYHDLLDSAITQTPEGIGLNYTKLIQAITFIQHESYKKTNKFNHIILLNKSTRTFTIIDSGEEFVEKIGNGQVKLAKGLPINANDPQKATFSFTSK